MTIEERIGNALLVFGDPVTKEPFVPLPGENPDRYYTIRVSTVPLLPADNAPQYDECYVLVHFICPYSYDYVERAALTKKALFDAGCTWPSMEDGIDDGQKDIIFECRIPQVIE